MCVTGMIENVEPVNRNKSRTKCICIPNLQSQMAQAEQVGGGC